MGRQRVQNMQRPWVLLALCAVHFAPTSAAVPLGNAVYTYAPKPFKELEDFNANGSLSVVNVYGGYIVKSLIEASINCTTHPVPSNKQVILEIDNTGEESVTILTCHKDGCKGTSGDDGFVKCPLNAKPSLRSIRDSTSWFSSLARKNRSAGQRSTASSQQSSHCRWREQAAQLHLALRDQHHRCHQANIV